MKNRIIMFAMAAIAAIGMISCGNPAEPENKSVSINNVDDYIVSMGEYKGLSVAATMEEADEEMLEYYSEYFFGMEGADLEGWKADVNDTVVIDYVGKIDGIAFNGGTASEQELKLGSHSYIEGFEEGLIGAVAGDERTLNLTFPEDYDNADFAGKACVFEVKVTAVLPHLCDEAVSMLNNEMYTTAAEYKNFVERAIKEYALEDYQNVIVGKAVDIVIANTTFAEIPENFLEKHKELVRNEYTDVAASYGLDVDTYLAYSGVSLSDMADMYAKQQLVFYKICNEENLYPTDSEIADNAEIFRSYYGYDSVDAFFAENPKNEFIDTLLGNKVFNYLLEVTNVTTE